MWCHHRVDIALSFHALSPLVVAWRPALQHCRWSLTPHIGGSWLVLCETGSTYQTWSSETSRALRVRGREKIFGAINLWVMFNREFEVKINRIGALAATFRALGR